MFAGFVYAHNVRLDSALVPCEELPLQATLAFEPASVAVMTSYIRCLALTDGKVIPEHVAREISEESKYRPIATDLPDQPVHPLPYQEPPVIDLRRAIQQLQYFCAASGTTLSHWEGDIQTFHSLYPESWTAKSESVCDWSLGVKAAAEEPKPGKELASVWRFMDLVSVADAHMNRRPERVLEVSLCRAYTKIGYISFPLT